MLEITSAGKQLMLILSSFLMVAVIFLLIAVAISIIGEKASKTGHDKLCEYNTIADLLSSHYEILNEQIYGIYDRVKDIKGHTIEISCALDKLKGMDSAFEIIETLAKQNAVLQQEVEDLQLCGNENIIEKEQLIPAIK
ncbi:MAG: hypothetical protein RSC52_02000 [Oscillospiraceae bacterium]